MSHLDPEKLKIPAYLRKKGITTRAKQKLILTALDRKNAGLSPKSTRALAPIKKPRSAKVAVQDSASSFAKSSPRARSRTFDAPLIEPTSARADLTPAQENSKLFRFLGASREAFQEEAKRKAARNKSIADTRFSNKTIEKTPVGTLDQEIFEQPEIFTSLQRPAFPDSSPQIIAETPTISKLVLIGKVIGYYAKIQVAIIHLEGTLRQGETIQFAGEKFLFQQPVESMQIDREDVLIAKKGADIGLKVAFEPVKGEVVYKMTKF